MKISEFDPLSLRREKQLARERDNRDLREGRVGKPSSWPMQRGWQKPGSRSSALFEERRAASLQNPSSTRRPGSVILANQATDSEIAKIIRSLTDCAGRARGFSLNHFARQIDADRNDLTTIDGLKSLAVTPRKTTHFQTRDFLWFHVSQKVAEAPKHLVNLSPLNMIANK